MAQWAQDVFSEMSAANEPASLADEIALTMEKQYSSTSAYERLLINNNYAVTVSNSDGVEKSNLSLPEDALQRLKEWRANYSTQTFTMRDDSAQTETTITLYGAGEQILTEADQQILLMFTQALFDTQAFGESK